MVGGVRFFEVPRSQFYVFVLELFASFDQVSDVIEKIGHILKLTIDVVIWIRALSTVRDPL